MKMVLSREIFIFAMALVAIFNGLVDAELEPAKNRRANGPSGLVAFPRVGRSDPNVNNNNNNNLHEQDSFDTFDNLYNNPLEDYEDFQKGEMKRSSLIAFPRIGRTDAEMRKWARLMALQQALDKRAGPSAPSGLWFGPRLGKRSVNSRDYEAAENNQNNLY